MQYVSVMDLVSYEPDVMQYGSVYLLSYEPDAMQYGSVMDLVSY